EFLDFARVELQFSPQSVDKYRDCLRQVQKIIGDLEVAKISAAEILGLKAAMLARGNSVCRQTVILAATKRLLSYCAGQLDLPVMPAESITIPKRPRREVAYLTADEVARFVSVIPLVTDRGRPYLSGLRFRA